MRNFQFTVSLNSSPLEEARKDGQLILTPMVSAESVTEAMNNAEIQQFCTSNNYRIFRAVT